MPEPHPSERRYRKILSKRRMGEPLCRLADRMKVKRTTLYWWHQRFAREECERAEQERQVLVPVEVSEPASVPAAALSSMLSPSVEVVLRDSGHVMRVPARFDTDDLLRLVDVLERR